MEETTRRTWRQALIGTALAVALLAGAGVTMAASPPQPTGTAAPQAGPMAHLLAKDSGQSLTAILALKQQDGTWKAVVAALKLNPATVQSQVATLRRARSHAAAVVTVLAKLSGKTPAEVRALKKKGVTWSQVASQLGLNWKTVLPQVQARLRARTAARTRTDAVVNLLTKLSGKTPAQVRALKKKGVTWVDVAHGLGIQ